MTPGAKHSPQTMHIKQPAMPYDFLKHSGNGLFLVCFEFKLLILYFNGDGVVLFYFIFSQPFMKKSPVSNFKIDPKLHLKLSLFLC